jgi:hypothetical protein
MFMHKDHIVRACLCSLGGETTKATMTKHIRKFLDSTLQFLAAAGIRSGPVRLDYCRVVVVKIGILQMGVRLDKKGFWHVAGRS